MFGQKSKHTAAPKKGRVSPRHFFFLLGDFWLSEKSPFPLARPGMLGSRRTWCLLCTEVRSSVKRLEKWNSDPSRSGKDSVWKKRIDFNCGAKLLGEE